MNDRIKQLRNDKGLSQASFGEYLGVSRDVINNLERGRVEIKEHIIKLLCSTFSVNEEWLKYGKGPMYIQLEEVNLDDFIKEKGGSPEEIAILKAYFELDPAIRKKMIEHFKRSLGYNAPNNLPIPTTETIAGADVNERVEAYRDYVETKKKAEGKLSV